MILFQLSARILLVGMFVSLGCQISFGSISAPYSEERAAVDVLIQQAKAVQSRPVALRSLQGVVANTDRPESVRRYALQEMAAIPEPELQKYFLDVAADKFGFDPKRVFRGLAIRGYWKSRLNLTHELTDQIALLEQGLEAEFEGVWASGVRRWSANELCDRGVSRMFPEIAQTFKSITASQEADREIEFCRAKINALSSFPTRFEALGSITRSVDPRRSVDPIEDLNFELASWAIHQLAKLQTDQAEEEIAQYILRLKNELQIEFGSSQNHLAVYYLRKFGWTDDDFLERGIPPMHLL